MKCSLCPRKCNIDRQGNQGLCGGGEQPKLARAGLHFWEEPCISGSRGSGAVFFSGCSLKCVYCQNEVISHGNFGKLITVERLGEIFFELQTLGAHNINLVNPSHYIGSISKALRAVKLKIPVVYNSSGYDSVEGLRLLDGLIQIYLPDLKYMDGTISQKYSQSENYFHNASAAILEMRCQVGATVVNQEGLMERGLMIRHLILPGLVKETIRILDWIKENLPEDVYVSLMSQFTPTEGLKEYPEINRRITRWEHEKAVGHFYKLGFANGYIQERDSADKEFIPDFNLQGI